MSTLDDSRKPYPELYTLNQYNPNITTVSMSFSIFFSI